MSRTAAIAKGVSQNTRQYRLRTSHTILLLRDVGIGEKVPEPVVECSKEVVWVARQIYSREKLDADREHVVILVLDTKHHVFAYKCLFSGTLNSASVFPRDIYTYALREGGAAFIMIHNHPSGKPDPSEEDRRITKTIKQGASLLDLVFLDHVILGRDIYYSFADDRDL